MRGKFIDLTGKTFGRLTVLRKNEKDKQGNILWECKCLCGSDKLCIVRTNSLNSGAIKSCGCLNAEAIKKLKTINTKYEYCTVDKCENKHYGLGFCERHYKQYNKYGKILTEEEITENRKKSHKKQKLNQKCHYCNDIGYLSKKYEIVLCSKHNAQLKYNGKILLRTRFDKNEFIINEEQNIAEILLYDKNKVNIANAIIDLNCLDIIKNYKWYLNEHGYAQTSLNKNKHISLHRLLLNPPKDLQVDHINRIRLDCRLSNLRICKQSDNNKNISIKASSKSGIRGVYFNGRYWIAYIGYNYKKIHIGSFKNVEDAIKARKEKELELFGEFAPIDYEIKDVMV